jgi:predicted NBD/HSP70 family sugar kinase
MTAGRPAGWSAAPLAGSDGQARSRARRPSDLMSTADIGSANRARILRALADTGPLSRADLARMTNVPRATIGAIVKGLLSEGLLEERPSEPPAAGIGKPSRPLWFGPRAGLSGAVLVRAGEVDSAVVNARGDVLEQSTHAFSPRTARDRLERELLDAVAPTFDSYRGELQGIGVAVPAACDPATGRVVACTPVPGLVDTRLAALLAERTGHGVLVEEDARALAVGQRWFGQARGVADFAALQIGAGIGAGIMLGGRLTRGHGVSSSEVGHTCVDIHGAECRCGLRGCWETIASLRWLRAEAGRRSLSGARGLTPGRLARRVEAGDDAAAGLLAAYADNIAVGIANLVHVLPLRLFVLHGDVVAGGELLLDEVRRGVARRTLRRLADDVRLELAGAEADFGVLGAAATALTHSFGLED